MDDFVLSNLYESRNEWAARLISTLSPLVMEGIQSIFAESWKMCASNGETTKYLMSFQNLLSLIPKWNSIIVEEEKKRIIERSGCNYLEDLITCTHIIQLKVLTCVRVGNRQKKIDISIPKLDHFIHKIYIHVARKVYTNVYLFERNISPLQIQKNNREFETIVHECIMTTIRESIPTEAIIRAYMDESVEHEEEVIVENLAEPAIGDDDGKTNENNESNLPSTSAEFPEPVKKEAYVVPTIKDIDDENVITRLSFNDMDQVLDSNTNKIEHVSAPKTLERLEEISRTNAIQRKLDEQEQERDDNNVEDRIKIYGDDIDLGELEIFDANGMGMSDDNLSLGIEVV
jgi:hypothetical protein